MLGRTRQEIIPCGFTVHRCAASWPTLLRITKIRNNENPGPALAVTNFRRVAAAGGRSNILDATTLSPDSRIWWIILRGTGDDAQRATKPGPARTPGRPHARASGFHPVSGARGPDQPGHRCAQPAPAP